MTYKNTEYMIYKNTSSEILLNFLKRKINTLLYLVKHTNNFNIIDYIYGKQNKNNF